MTGSETVVQGILLTFALMVITMPAFIRLLRRLGMGKRIRVEGPESHYIKAGTPTMGGLLIILVVGGTAVGLQLATNHFIDPSTFAPLATLALVGLLGTADDWLNARTGDGIRGRQKLLWQTVVAFAAAWQIQQTYDITAIVVPFVGAIGIAPWAYVLFAAFAIVATSNGVNITDGLDGLAGGTLIFAFVGFLLIAGLNPGGGQPNLAALCALIIGALLGFLWFNAHPAQIIMGDSGALALGATLAVTALITGQILLLPLIGIIFVVETGSVIIQVLSYKILGRRIFRMSPLHHHYELSGWDEEKITLRFWIVGVLAAMVGVAFFLGTRGLLVP
ncbi:MAG: phospho-N-acetylmuramoyl-pentapeptide-transferase [Chloroflexota bacterium]|nr:phospho-N-acetylmuramoyl-pentapeptide-transferase [Chloroflexota bacterium]